MSEEQKESLLKAHFEVCAKRIIPDAFLICENEKKPVSLILAYRTVLAQIALTSLIYSEKEANVSNFFPVYAQVLEDFEPLKSWAQASIVNELSLANQKAYENVKFREPQ